MDEGGLAWDDLSNNRAFLASTICATLNGASIYIEALRKPDQYKTADGKPLKDDIQHAFLPAGPKGVFGLHLVQSHVIPTYSKNQKAAKDLLRFMQTKANYEPWFEYRPGLLHAAHAGWEFTRSGHRIRDGTVRVDRQSQAWHPDTPVSRMPRRPKCCRNT